jgi:hypothetical protein
MLYQVIKEKTQAHRNNAIKNSSIWVIVKVEYNIGVKAGKAIKTQQLPNSRLFLYFREL